VKEYQLFPSTVWSTELDLDLDELRREAKDFSLTHPSQNYSNVGGYQANCFDYKPLINSIKNNAPRCNEIELGDLYIFSWLNINGQGSYNLRHTHSDGINFLSGTYYVSVPKDSGGIVFHDSKPPIFYSMADMRYFGRDQMYRIEPKENMLLYFPGWLEHEVEPNNSNEERISISFNLIRKEDVDRYQQFYNYA
tara:strand:- start:45 stop:626 length:582 start_codon:yes stop_codon:yes gene_type:complete